MNNCCFNTWSKPQPKEEPLQDCKCPKCHGENFEGVEIEICGDNEIRQKMQCHNPTCEHTWTNVYTLTSRQDES